MSQVLLAGGFPTLGAPPYDLAGDWWYSSTTSSTAWRYIPTFYDNIGLFYGADFDIVPSELSLQPGDLIILDVIQNEYPYEPVPDSKPDHVRVVVGSGNTSTNQADYTNGCGVNLEIPTQTPDLLIDQNCVDRWHVSWDYNIDPESNVIAYVHVTR